MCSQVSMCSCVKNGLFLRDCLVVREAPRHCARPHCLMGHSILTHRLGGNNLHSGEGQYAAPHPPPWSLPPAEIMPPGGEEGEGAPPPPDGGEGTEAPPPSPPGGKDAPSAGQRHMTVTTERDVNTSGSTFGGHLMRYGSVGWVGGEGAGIPSHSASTSLPCFTRNPCCDFRHCALLQGLPRAPLILACRLTLCAVVHTQGAGC